MNSRTTRPLAATTLGVALALMGNSAEAQPDYSTSTFRTYPTGQWPRSAATADFNADGFLDLAVGCVGSEVVSILLGDGAGGFLPERRTLTIFGPDSIAAADFDEDGLPDVALTRGFDDLVIVFFGDGAGGVSRGSGFRVAGYPASLAAGDWNADGHVDLAVGGRQGRAVHLLAGDGEGGLAIVSSHSVDYAPGRFVVADADGDGHEDLAVATVGPLNVHWLFGDGAFGFPRATHLSVPWDATALAAADLNEDGRLDLVVGSNEDRFTPRPDRKFVTLFHGDGIGGFAAVARLPLGVWPDSIVATDLDGDGHADIAVASRDHRLAIFPGYGPGGFPSRDVARHVLGMGGSPRIIAPGDFDGDAHLDLALVQWSGANSSGFDGTVALVRGRGRDGFVLPRPLPLGPDAGVLLSADFDGDGHADVAGASYFERAIFVSRGDGIGGFTPLGTVDLAIEPNVVGLGDFDEDGHADIVAGGTWGASVSLHRGTGDGGFAFATSIPAPGAHVRCTLAADLDLDGHLDLAIAHGDAPQVLTTYLGDGTGGFTESASLVLNPAYSFVYLELADMNEDAVPDLVTQEWLAEGPRIVLALGDGTGRFEPAVPIDEAAVYPDAMRTADFDEDGHLDLAVCDRGGLAIVLMDGAGRARSRSFVATPFDVGRSLVAADYDGDGHVDLASAALAHDDVTFFMGDGTGAMEPHVGFGVAAGGAGTIVAADFDEDGRPDVAVGAFHHDAGSLFLSRRIPVVDALRGNVNAAAGPIADVLFVNGSAGDASRSISLAQSEPFALTMAAPPSAGAASFAAYAWIGAGDPNTMVSLPSSYGYMSLAPELTGGRPKRTWNNTGDPAFGAPDGPSAPAPSTIFERAAGLRRTIVFTVQGIVEDAASPSGTYAVTNGLRVDVR